MLGLCSNCGCSAACTQSITYRKPQQQARLSHAAVTDEEELRNKTTSVSAARGPAPMCALHALPCLP